MIIIISIPWRLLSRAVCYGCRGVNMFVVRKKTHLAWSAPFFDLLCALREFHSEKWGKDGEDEIAKPGWHLFERIMVVASDYETIYYQRACDFDQHREEIFSYQRH